MLNMVKGCTIQDPSLLYEGYQHTETGYIANVNAENIQPLFNEFLMRQDDRVFLILEIPTNAGEEKEIAPGVFEALHVDVHYLDGMPKEYAVDFLATFSELLIHDGMCRFGFGVHSGQNEIMRDYYNVVTIYTNKPEMYDGLFETVGISEQKTLKTAWQYFTPETPGECRKIIHKGKDIYEIAEYLKQYGLYFAERREKF